MTIIEHLRRHANRPAFPGDDTWENEARLLLEWAATALENEKARGETLALDAPQEPFNVLKLW